MRKLFYILTVFILAGCASNDGTVTNDQRTIQKRVVAVKNEGNSTIVSSGRLDTWYRINSPLTEGWIYDVSLEIPRVVTEPVIVPATLLDFTPIDLLHRDLFGRYITKYQELRTVEPKKELSAN